MVFEVGEDFLGLDIILIYGTGISQADLMVLERDAVYSLSKERTACCFYIMQCTQSINDDISQIPISEAIERFGSSHCHSFW